MTIGVFGLKKVYKRQYQNVLDGNFVSWPESATYGYFGGGDAGPAAINTITRIDFSNETVNNPGKNLPAAVQQLAATSSSSYGYFGGGSTISTITRLDFSNETVSSPGNNLPSARNQLAAVTSSSYGYFGGGETSTPALISTISRLDFSNETLSNLSNNLPSARDQSGATSSNSYGYYGGGATTSSPPITRINTISRLDFSTETTSDPGKNLPSTRLGPAATSSNSYGYFGGGGTPPTVISTISRIDFSNETVSDPGNLPSARSSSAAVSSGSYGYFGGGFAPPPTAQICTITRLDFSNETLSDFPPSNALPSRRNNLAATSGGASVSKNSINRTYGYYGGGLPTPATSIFRLDFSNETVSVPGKNLPSDRQNGSATSSSSYGYFGGGAIGPISTFTSIISRLDFSNEISSNLSNTSSSLQKRELAATSSSSYGYFGGGVAGAVPPSANSRSTITRLDFSNETVSDPGKNLPSSSAIFKLAATSSSYYGYFVGGTVGDYPPVSFIQCTITRLDFSNETTFQSPLLPFSSTLKLPSDRAVLAATSNSSYAYFGGGSNGPSDINTISRLDFSTETCSDPGKNLPSVRAELAATSSSFYGYFAGGDNSISTISRLDFSNETCSDPGNNLPTGKRYLSAFSNSN